uniref:Uncharacterized protein n=1 Tax=Plectus sambesii TaxID=2011161 RepID=A0A914WWU0_9BILA
MDNSDVRVASHPLVCPRCVIASAEVRPDGLSRTCRRYVAVSGNEGNGAPTLSLSASDMGGNILDGIWTGELPLLLWEGRFQHTVGQRRWRGC